MRRSFGLLVCLLTVGCVSTQVQRLDDAVRPAASPEAVTLLSEAPLQPYTVIAVIEAKGGSVFDSFDDLRDELAVEAAKLGGDALILGPGDTDTDFVFTGIAMIRSDERHLTAQVIVYERGDAW